MANIGQAGNAIVLVAALLWVGPARAGDATVKCQEAKLKAQGKLELCLKKSSAKVLGGAPNASAACQAKFQTALSKAENIAVAAGTTACRYVDDGDGTVSDLNTGLVWEKKDTSCPGGPHCYSDYFSWTSGPPYIADGTAFTDFLYGLNGGTSLDGTATSGCFAGHCDWRLPTIEELAGIVDVTQGDCGGGSGPCIDPVFGPTQANAYWSASTVFGGQNFAFYMRFYVGGVYGDFKASTYFVRAVRGGL